MIFRVLDIETIPDLKVWTPGESTYKVVPHKDLQLTNSMGVDFEEVVPFPPPHAHRVVAISYVDIEFDPSQTPKYKFSHCHTECRWSREFGPDMETCLDAEEHKLLSSFGAAMAGDADIHFVTWNGRTFDLPVISLRSFKHKIACSWYYNKKDVRYRYSTEGHCDLMDYLSDFGAARQMKLHDAARLWGLPGKTDMSGSQISDIYQSTVKNFDLNLEEIQAGVARYCLQDSIQTALLFIATRYHIGKVTESAYNAIIDTFSASSTINEAISLDWDRLKLSGKLL